MITLRGHDNWVRSVTGFWRLLHRADCVRSASKRLKTRLSDLSRKVKKKRLKVHEEHMMAIAAAYLSAHERFPAEVQRRTASIACSARGDRSDRIRGGERVERDICRDVQN